ncbi:MAG: SprB repeat-containing protein [Flavobacteriales bacterium]|nr:SprB repeat-containing protein [Flavobacteriales bacterium]
MQPVCGFTTVLHAWSLLTLLQHGPLLRQANGMVTAYGHGGTPPYTYSWSTGREQTLGGLVGRVSAVTVTDTVTAGLHEQVIEVPLESAYTFYQDGMDCRSAM